jgi:hypothetical protein
MTGGCRMGLGPQSHTSAFGVPFSPCGLDFLFIVPHGDSDAVHGMRLARLLGKLRGAGLRLALRRVRERGDLLGILVYDAPNEFHAFRLWRGLSGAGRLAHPCLRLLLLGLDRRFLGHPFNSLPIRQSLRHGIIRFSGSPDRKPSVPLRPAGLYQIYRGRANPFDRFRTSIDTNHQMARGV